MSNLFLAFKHATRGLIIGVKSERNLKIHALAALLVIFLSLITSISLIDFIILLLMIGLVIGMELVNSAIEKICDVLRDRYHLPYEASRDIRDIAAGAVWLQAIIAALIGVLIFSKYL